MSNLYYLGDNAFDGATTFGVSGGNGGQIGNPQWHQVT
jgi:hypothetical protein